MLSSTFSINSMLFFNLDFNSHDTFYHLKYEISLLLFDIYSVWHFTVLSYEIVSETFSCSNSFIQIP